MLLGPAGIHPHQHLGPILGLGAAGAGVDFHVAIIGVGFAGEQAFDLAALGVLGNPLQCGFRLSQDRLIPFHFR
jgi:hypothetical protein